MSALPRGKDVVTIPITVQATAPPGQRVVLLLAQTAKGNRSAALLISLPVQVSPPVILSHDPAGPIPLPPGQSATVTLKARRVGGVKSAVSFDFPGLPRGVTVEGPKKIAPGQSEVALTFHAGPHAGGRVQVGIQAKATVNNQVVPLGPNRTFLTLAIGAAPPRKTPSPSRKKPPVQEAGNG